MKLLCFFMVTIAIDENGLVALFAKHPEQAGRRGAMKGIVTFQCAHVARFKDGSSLTNPIEVIKQDESEQRRHDEQYSERIAGAEVGRDRHWGSLQIGSGERIVVPSGLKGESESGEGLNY
jgi:hypothetical protein